MAGDCCLSRGLLDSLHWAAVGGRGRRCGGGGQCWGMGVGGGEGHWLG